MDTKRWEKSLGAEDSGNPAVLSRHRFFTRLTDLLFVPSFLSGTG